MILGHVAINLLGRSNKITGPLIRVMIGIPPDYRISNPHKDVEQDSPRVRHLWYRIG